MRNQPERRLLYVVRAAERPAPGLPEPRSNMFGVGELVSQPPTRRCRRPQPALLRSETALRLRLLVSNTALRERTARPTLLLERPRPHHHGGRLRAQRPAAGPRAQP